MLPPRIDATTERLYRHVDEDASGVSEARDRLLALGSARDMVASASTWPWRPETPRWLVSALVVPLILWGRDAAPGARRPLRRGGLRLAALVAVQERLDHPTQPRRLDVLVVISGPHHRDRQLDQRGEVDGGA